MKELKRLFTRKTIHKRVLSSLLAMLLVITSVVHPINMVPAYATGDWLDVDYQKQDKNDLELYVQTESASFEPGETVVFDLFVQNNSSEEYTDFGISFRDKKDAFAEAEFILTDACGEAYITEKGNVTNLYLAPGETKALQFEGTLNDDLDVLDRKEIAFFCGGYDGNEEAVTVTTEFPFTVGLFNELSIDFTDGTELIPDENNTLEITIGFNDIGYYYDTDVATDSNAKVNTDSNADLATDSDAKLATDSDADEDYVFDLTNVTLDLETVGVKFEKVKLEEASINEENGTITALVSYKVDEDAEAGEYFGTVAANVKNGKKVYQAQTGFQFEVEEVTNSTFKKYGLFTAEIDNFTVNVDVAKGAFDEKVELVVTELAEDSEEFKTAEEAMEASEREFDGMMALDICFINGDGEEVEPKEGYSVQVSIEMKAEVLPEGIDTESLMVHHIAETTTDDVQAEVELVVEDVADTADATAGIVEVKEDAEEAVVAAEFSVEGFSTFTITWNNSNSQLIVKYVTEANDTDAAKLILDNMPSEDTVISANELGADFNITNYAPTTAQYTDPTNDGVTKYVFSQAVLKNGNDSYSYTDISNNAIRWSSNQLQYYSTGIYGYGGSWNQISNNAILYLVYEPTVKTENTKDFISITLKDFDEKEWAGPDQKEPIDYDKRFVIGGSKSGWMNSWTNNSDPNNRNSLGVVQGIVENTLSISKYPVLDFDSSKQDETQYTLEKFFTGNNDKTYKGCNYLFQKDKDGYYFYDSSKNFAQLDTLTKEFTVYNSPRVVTNAGTDPQFIPFNNKGVASSAANYYFGMTVEFDFIMPKEGKVNGEDMIFSFAGDDDVWVFIDDVLVLDMGGVHLSNEGYINFATGNVHVDKVYKIGKIENNSKPDNRNLKDIYDSSNPAGDIKWTTNADNQTIYSDYTKHTLKFFYMERGAGGSNCKIKFNLPVVPQKSLTVTKELVSEDSQGNAATHEYIANSVEYKFRVIEKDTITPYIPAGVKYDILVGDQKVDEGTTKEGGFFYLKAGQSAQFENMLQYDKKPSDGITPEYVVEEVMENSITGQYNGVQFEINGDGGTVLTEGKPSGDDDNFVSFTTKPLKADETQYAFYRNKLDVTELSSLSITKQAESGSAFDDNKEFKITVKLGNKLIPEGTVYQLNGKEIEVEKEGIIPLHVGETATIVKGIIAGTTYEVTEEDGAGYTATYSGYVESTSDKIDPNITNKDVSGEVTPGDSVYITVTNADYDFHADVTISKELLFNTDERTFSFSTVQVKNEADWTPVEGAKKILDRQITVTDSQVKTNVIKFGYGADAVTGYYYYKITENNNKISGVIYDENFYIVKVYVDADNNTANIVNILKNGTTSLGEDAIAAFVNKSAVSVKVVKTVTGGLGDWDKAFKFEMKVLLSDNTEYRSDTFYLKHNEKYENIVPINSKIQIAEKNAEGYDVTVKVGDNKIEAVNGIYTIDINSEGIVIAVENNKEANPDTGISMDTLPYILIMLAVIGGIAFTIIRRRKDDELD